MFAIFLKELRENFKWALLMMLALGAFMVYPSYHDTQPPLVSWEMHSVTCIGFSVAAFILGALQVLQDHWRGRWAFLIHRPLTKSRIFLAKLAAGMVLYLPCAAIPLTVATIWIAIPGHVAMPFDWHMILPRIADLIGGVVWYLAGLLVAARNARWIGSRLFPAGLAFIAAVFAGDYPGLFMSNLILALGAVILIYIGTALILLPAAWGAFVKEGEYESEPLGVRLLQTVSVTAGVLVLYVMAITFAGNILDAFTRTQSNYTSYVITDDGRPYVATNNAGTIIAAVDLAGRVLSKEELSNLEKRTYNHVQVNLSDADQWYDYRSYQIGSNGLQNNWSYVYPLDLDYGHLASWYYVVPRQTIEGYAFKTNQYMGSISLNGFAPPEQAPERVPATFLTDDQSANTTPPIVANSSDVYTLDAATRQLHRVFEAGADNPIVDATYLAIGNEEKKRIIYLVIAAQSSVHVIKDGASAVSIPLDHHFPEYGELEIGPAANGQFILRYLPDYSNKYRNTSSWVEQANNLGQIVERTELPPLKPNISPSPKLAIISFGLLIPPGILSAPLFATPPNDDPDWPPAVVGMRIGAIAWPLIAFVLMGRYASTVNGKILWMAICVLLGLPGILLLLCMRQAVARQECPACGRPRLVTRELCEHCGREFAEPLRLGIEILKMA